jgi:hypothetical protein
MSLVQGLLQPCPGMLAQAIHQAFLLVVQV